MTASELVVDNVFGTRLRKLVLCVINRHPERSAFLDSVTERAPYGTSLQICFPTTGKNLCLKAMKYDIFLQSRDINFL